MEIRDLKSWTVVDLVKCKYAGGACFSPTGDRILILYNGVHEYDAYTGTHIRDYTQEQPTAVSYSADGQRIAVASQLGYVAIHDAVTGEETLRLDAGAGAIVFARDGTSLLTSEAPDRGLYFWQGMKETAPR